VIDEIDRGLVRREGGIERGDDALQRREIALREHRIVTRLRRAQSNPAGCARPSMQSGIY
jgi:hypothetical protein